MQHQILLVSENAKDLEFWEGVATSANLAFSRTTDSKVVATHLVANPETIVLWDVSCPETRAIEDLLKANAIPSRVFAITEAPINSEPTLFKPAAFGHHFYRRYDPPAPRLYEKLILCAGKKGTFALKDFFGDIQGEHSVTLTHSHQKNTALEELHDFLSKHNVMERLASAGVDAADELLMNAIFDAPWSKTEGYFRRKLERDVGFEFPEAERVELNAIVGTDLIGIRVRDNFGSVDGQKIINKLSCDFEAKDYIAPEDDPGAGLEIYKINKAAMTLLFVVEPGVKTEVIVLFGNKQSYRELKTGFCFFSVIHDQ